MDITQIQAQLEAIRGEHSGFSHRVVELHCSPIEGLHRVSARFHYLSFRDGLPTSDEFVRYLKDQLIPFCIPKRERDKVVAALAVDPANFNPVIELYDKARNLFISARKLQATSGEPGELTLFILLEWALRAPQMVSKMFLKTANNMAVHGTDGIHARFDPETKELVLYWGESKLYEEFSGALDAVFESITKFLEKEKSKSREIDLVRDHHNFGPGEESLKASLLEYLNPYSPQSNKHRKVFACFVGFDFAAFHHLSEFKAADVEAKFVERCNERITSALELIASKIKKHQMENINFEFFMLPFPSVADLRSKFFAETGIHD